MTRVSRAGAETEIHPSAVVEDGARLAAGVRVGPHAAIGAEVEIGEGTVVGPHTVITGPTRIGAGNRFYGQAAVGSDPQDLKYRGERSFLEIGDGNLVREFVTINRGTEGGGGRTVLGDRNLLMTGVHVAHDCLVGSDVIFGNAVTLAGHVTIEDCANVGAFSGVQQFCRVGAFAFIGGYSVVTRDALPYVKLVGERSSARIFGINTIGLERRGVPPGIIETLKAAYRVLFRSDLKVKDAVAELRPQAAECAELRHLLDFIEASERGFVR